MTNYARCTPRGIKFRTVVARASINKKTLFISNWTYKFKGGGWNSEMLPLGVALCGAETWTLRKADQKYLESSEIWCWRRMEKIS